MPGLVLYDGIAVSNTAAPSTAPPAIVPGSAQDIANRIISLLPRRWFANTKGPAASPTGLIGLIIYGSATALSWIYSLIQYTANQTRRTTTSDAFLDLGLFDFFGRRIRRKPSQTDASVRAMWKKEVLRRRNTREYVQRAVQDLTGTPVKIFEAFNPMDTGGLGAQWAFNEPRSAWGSNAYPYTMFITAVEPVGTGIPNLSGLNDSYGGFGAGQFALADTALTTGAVTNQDIYDMINATRAAGIKCWVKIGPPPVTSGRLGIDFQIGVTPLL